MKPWFILAAIAASALIGVAEEKRDISITVRNEKPEIVLQILEHLSKTKVTAAPEVAHHPARVSFSVTQVTKGQAIIAILHSLQKAGIKVERAGNDYHATVVPNRGPPAPRP